MQRYGPPPSYPNLKIPGLNSPIPEVSFGGLGQAAPRVHWGGGGLGPGLLPFPRPRPKRRFGLPLSRAALSATMLAVGASPPWTRPGSPSTETSSAPTRQNSRCGRGGEGRPHSSSSPGAVRLGVGVLLTCLYPPDQGGGGGGRPDPLGGAGALGRGVLRGGGGRGERRREAGRDGLRHPGRQVSAWAPGQGVDAAAGQGLILTPSSALSSAASSPLAVSPRCLPGWRPRNSLSCVRRRSRRPWTGERRPPPPQKKIYLWGDEEQCSGTQSLLGLDREPITSAWAANSRRSSSCCPALLPRKPCGPCARGGGYRGAPEGLEPQGLRVTFPSPASPPQQRDAPAVHRAAGEEDRHRGRGHDGLHPHLRHDHGKPRGSSGPLLPATGNGPLTVDTPPLPRR